jgi:hypothetical protein
MVWVFFGLNVWEFERFDCFWSLKNSHQPPNTQHARFDMVELRRFSRCPVPLGRGNGRIKFYGFSQITQKYGAA